MGRILFFILIGLLVWLIVRGTARAAARQQAQANVRSTKPEDMVRCARCGVNMPRSEAREEAGQMVCRDNPACHPRP